MMLCQFSIADVVFFINNIPMPVNTTSLSEFTCDRVNSDFVVDFLPWNESIYDYVMKQPLSKEKMFSYIDNTLYFLVYDDMISIGAITVFTEDRHVKCYYSAERFTFSRAKNISQFIPMYSMLNSKGVIILHASQISYGNKSILFTAPSGTGKSTQAELWKKYLNANIISGDRTAIRKTDGRFYSFGIPFDGSAKISRNIKSQLGAIVVLSQAEENTVIKLSPTDAFKHLFSQTNIDYEHDRFVVNGTETVGNISCECPVYLLSCTPDSRAVYLLKKTLEDDGIL